MASCGSFFGASLVIVRCLWISLFNSMSCKNNFTISLSTPNLTILRLENITWREPLFSLYLIKIFCHIFTTYTKWKISLVWENTPISQRCIKLALWQYIYITPTHMIVTDSDMYCFLLPQVVEINVKVESAGQHNVHQNAFYAEETLLKS